jgi:hypothetical protein
LLYLDIRENPRFCKDINLNYSAWPVKQARDDETTWQKQLNQLPNCAQAQATGFAKLEFIGLQESYKIGEVVKVDLKVDFTGSHPGDQVDLWVAVRLPEDNILFLTPYSFDPFRPTQQAFQTNLGSIKTVFPIIPYFEVQTGMGGNYTFYAAFTEMGKNPIKNGAVIRQITQADTILSNR